MKQLFRKIQMEIFIRKNLLIIIGVAVGSIAGFLYYQQVGCSTGNCAITSSPINSSIYGAVMATLILSLFKK